MAVAVGPLLSRTETLLELQLATARSGKLSPFRLPIATEAGSAPTAKLVAAPKEPVPFPSRIETLSEPALATARSGKLSPSRLPIATEWGTEPTVKLVAAPKEPVPFPSRTETLSELVLWRPRGRGSCRRSGCRSRPRRGWRRRRSWLPRRRCRCRCRAGPRRCWSPGWRPRGRGSCRRSGCRSRLRGGWCRRRSWSPRRRCRCRCRAGPRRCRNLVGDREVGEAVAVQVADRDRVGIGADGEVGCRTEGAGRRFRAGPRRCRSR